jgi:cytochrome c-type biogenesis protein CcmH
MIAPQMADATNPRRRVGPATLALGLAALLATVAIVYALVVRGGNGDAATGNSAAGNAMAGAQGGNLDAMIASLRERLRQDPDNDQGWFLLGLSFRNAGDFAQAEQAFRRAMELRPNNADYVAYLGETLILKGSEGQAPPAEASQLFNRALQIDPNNAQAKYYLATLKDMRGDHRGAIDDLIALLRSAPADAPWTAQVREAVTAIARQNHIDVAGRLPPPPPAGAAAPTTATAAIPGPTPDQMRQASAIPPSQQDQMVRAMVDGLAARLRQNPRDAEGWIRLMRSRMVLHDEAAARQALQSGLAAFQNDAATQTRLREAASQLGIPTS